MSRQNVVKCGRSLALADNTDPSSTTSSQTSRPSTLTRPKSHNVPLSPGLPTARPSSLVSLTTSSESGLSLLRLGGLYAWISRLSQRGEAARRALQIFHPGIKSRKPSLVCHGHTTRPAALCVAASFHAGTTGRIRQSPSRPSCVVSIVNQQPVSCPPSHVEVPTVRPTVIPPPSVFVPALGGAAAGLGIAASDTYPF